MGHYQNLNDINYVKSESLSYEGNLDYSKFVKITQKQNDELKRSQLKENDILISMAGAYLGKSGLVKKEILPANTNQAVAILTTNSKINYIFLWFKLRSPKTVNYFNSIPSQSAQPNINFEEIKSFPFPLPPLPEQQAIAAILSSLDDKIELLRDQNKTLEELGQKLFQKELAENGDDWEEMRLGEIVDLLNGFAFKSDDFVEFGDYRLVTIKNVQDGEIHTNNSNFIARAPLRMPKYCSLEIGDILLSLTGNVGRSGIVVDEKLFLNQRVCKIEPKNSLDKGFVYFFFRQDEVKKKLIDISKGTAQQNLSPIDTANLKYLLPNGESFKNLLPLNNLISKILANAQQIQTLSKIRDTLLPQLMSGEVRVGVN